MVVIFIQNIILNLYKNRIKYVNYLCNVYYNFGFFFVKLDTVWILLTFK